jgi:hypothetical protein
MADYFGAQLKLGLKVEISQVNKWKSSNKAELYLPFGGLVEDA